MITSEFRNYPHCQDAHDYAVDVVAGKIPNCIHAVNACKRYLNDLEREGFRYVFDPYLGSRACNFIELLPHTKGPWAGKKKKLILEPWQKFIIANVFGWIDETTGFRRFSELDLFVPRKNGKSILGAAIGAYLFCADGEYAPEIFSGATNAKQAMEVFKPMRLMCKKTPDLCEKYGIEVNASNLAQPDTGGKVEPVIGNPGDGASPSCWIVDEYHEHPNSDQVDTAVTGMGSREQPLLVVITTAGSDTSSACYAKYEELIDILSGNVQGDEIFGIIYGLDDTDEYYEPGMDRKANPNYGISVLPKYMETQIARAQRNSAHENKILIKNFNRWTSSKSAWISSLDWKKCGDSALYEGDFINDECIGGIDLASKIDLTAWVRLYLRIIEGERHYFAFGNWYLPEVAIEKSENARYREWVKDGLLDICGDREIKYAELRHEIKKYAKTCNVREITYDSWKASQLAQELEDEGLLMVEFRQNPSSITPAMRELEAAITAGRFHHSDDPVLNWQMMNVVRKDYPTGLTAAIKEKPHNKIDGPIAIIMAVGRAMHDLEVEESVYDKRGVREL